MKIFNLTKRTQKSSNGKEIKFIYSSLPMASTLFFRQIPQTPRLIPALFCTPRTSCTFITFVPTSTLTVREKIFVRAKHSLRLIANVRRRSDDVPALTCKYSCMWYAAVLPSLADSTVVCDGCWPNESAVTASEASPPHHTAGGRLRSCSGPAASTVHSQRPVRPSTITRPVR